jgi:hypothetical protein
VDHSFASEARSYRAVNDQGYFVDLIRPMERDEIRSHYDKLGASDDDLHAATISNLHWLINALLNAHRRYSITRFDYKTLGLTHCGVN